MKKIAFCFVILLGLGMIPTIAWACSCAWGGPFLTVARDALLVVRGRIVRHHPGKTPTMDVHVLEILYGGLLDSGMSIQMGDGMHCRPPMDGFPPGTEWILAINGPGSKPGNGLALSHCGQYWLKVENGDVIGSIDGDQNEVQRMPLGEFRNRFFYPKFDERFTGRVESGKRFSKTFAGRFEFVLEPMPEGWEIVVKELGRNENLSRLTPPLHFAPNPREIEGWHLSDKPADCASRPYQTGLIPEKLRKFIFSPQVGKQIDGPDVGRSVTVEEIQAVERFGRGSLMIEKFVLEPGKVDCPKIEWMEFSVILEGGY